MFVSGQEVGCPLTRGLLPHLPISCFLVLIIGPVHHPGAGALARAFGMEHPSAKKKKCSFCSPEHRALLQPCELTRLWGQGAATCQLELKRQGQKTRRKWGGRGTNLVGGRRKQSEGPSGRVEAPGHPQVSPPSPTSLPLWKALLVTSEAFKAFTLNLAPTPGCLPDRGPLPSCSRDVPTAISAHAYLHEQFLFF